MDQRTFEALRSTGLLLATTPDERLDPVSMAVKRVLVWWIRAVVGGRT